MAGRPSKRQNETPTIRYTVTRTCTDFSGRYWEAGQVAEVPIGTKVPRWFKVLEETSGDDISPTPADDGAKTLSELALKDKSIVAPGTTKLD